MDNYTYYEGHFVGHDGFVVPADFNEFFTRFPQLVLAYVRRRRQHGADDLESELLLYLMTLPQRSKYREAGLTDRIQTFDPARSYGASRARWQNWLNSLLHNRLCNLMCQLTPPSVGLDAITELACQAQQLSTAEVYVARFASFAETHRPGLGRIANTLAMDERSAVDERDRHRLQMLHHHWSAGTTPPKPRKSYRPRQKAVQ